MATVYFDNEMTKQELQMENRRMRNFIKTMVDTLTDMDIEFGKQEGVHRLCDRLLADINHFVSTMPTDEWIARAIDKGRV